MIMNLQLHSCERRMKWMLNSMIHGDWVAKIFRIGKWRRWGKPGEVGII